MPLNISDLHRKADVGSVVAQTVLGLCYLEGVDVEVDYRKAFSLLSSAAEHRAPRAMFGLGRMYLDGLGVARNVSEAVRLFETAAGAGEFAAQIELGRIYARGIEGLPAQQERALRWYTAAASQAENVGDSEEIREAQEFIESITKSGGRNVEGSGPA